MVIVWHTFILSTQRLTNLRDLVVEEEGVEHVVSAVLHHEDLQELSTEHTHLMTRKPPSVVGW